MPLPALSVGRGKTGDLVSFTQRELIIALAGALLGYLIGRYGAAAKPHPGPGLVDLQQRVVAAAGWNEPGNWSVQLLETGQRKINVIKSIRDMTRLGLKEAKDLSEAHMPVTILEDISEETAKRAVAEFESSGATARMVQKRGGAR